MTVQQFIAACRNKGWYFTANWMQRKYNQLIGESDAKEVIREKEEVPRHVSRTGEEGLDEHRNG